MKRDSGEGAVIAPFLHSIVDLMQDFQTKELVFFFDSKHSKRREIYSGYKGNRKPSTSEEKDEREALKKDIVAIRRDLLPSLGFQNIHVQKGYEVDDLIAAYCKELDEAVIVTADADLKQCVRKGIIHYNPITKKKTTIRVLRSEGYDYPSWVWKVKAVSGCSSDNIPGIMPRVGEKTALAGLREAEGMPDLVVTKRTKKMIAALNEFSKTKAGLKALTRNSSLVKLPFPGTKDLHNTYRKDKTTSATWNLKMKELRIRELIGNY
jgi:5'-3' exonuclease